jgi:diketogulonate reductase-like aldo/keto reductase
LEFKRLGKSDVQIPVLGLGTWGIGGFSSRRLGGEDQDVAALRLGLDLGMHFIDTAEMYAHGHSEEVVATAVEKQRADVFIATKVSAENLSYERVMRSCDASLRRLNTDYIDLYQVHWPNPRIPIAETMKAMEKLVEEGKVRHIGVSNFSVEQTRQAQESLTKNSIASNQVEYNLTERSIEDNLLPYCAREKVTVIAYSPVARGQLAGTGRDSRWHTLDSIATKYSKTRTQVALNWLICKEPVVAIPKAGRLEHVRENGGAVGWALKREDQDALNMAFN